MSGKVLLGFALITPQAYDSIYSRRVVDNYLSRLDRRVIGGRLAGGMKCTGFVSERDPDRYHAVLRRYLPVPHRSRARGTVLELGCGFGRLSCWLAGKLDVNFIGIDFSRVAIKRAREFARNERTSRKPRFKVSDFSNTGLASSSVMGAISLDALYLATDRTRVLRELHRVLIPDGPLFFTVYVRASGRASRERPSLQTWLRTLKATKFSVIEHRNVSAKWRHKMRLKHKQRWNHRHEIIKRLGKAGEAELQVSASMLGLGGKPSFLDSVSRFEILALTRKSGAVY